AGLALCGAQLWAAPVALRDLSTLDEAKIKADLPALFQADAKPSLAELDQAVIYLMNMGRYENVFIDRAANGDLTVIGKPLRLVEEIRIHGANEVDEDDLRALLEIKTNERFDRKKAVSSAEKIKNHYGEEGYFNAIVELSFNKTDSGNIRLDIEIQEKEPCRIQSLIFETANTDLKERLDSRFRRLQGRKLTTERARKLVSDLNEYLIDNRYLATEIIGPDAHYNPAKTEAFLRVEVREPYRWEFYFSGHDYLTQTGLYKALDLRNEERKNLDPAGEGGERIRREYLERGFPNAGVQTKILNPQGSYLKRVYYAIEEGPRVKIRSIDVQGRVSRNSKYYQKFIMNNSSDLVKEGYYNRQDLERGFKNLVTELRNQGFLRARTLSSRVEYGEKKSEVTVHLLLEEGPQTQIRALDFEGNKFFSNFELSQVTGLETNRSLKLNEFEASLDKLKMFYRNQGFLEMRLLNESEDVIQYNDKGTQARIVFRIFEGPRIRVNAIVIEGNTFTKSRVILKEADFKVGEVLTPQKLEEATVRLNKLGLFQRADVQTLEEGTNVAERTLIINVTERDPGLFRFGGGVNNERGVTMRGFTGIGYNNLGGTGRAISGRVEVRSNVSEVKYPEHEIAAGYLEPFIFNTRTRGRVNLTRSERVFAFKKANDEARITTSNRVDFLAERDLTRYMKLTWKTCSLDSSREFERHGRCLSETDPDAEIDPTRGKCPAITMQVATIGPTLDIDYRDNPFLPTRGSFTRFVVDYSRPDLGSSDGVEFWRGEMNHTQYTRVYGPRWVWANSARAGYLRNLNGDYDETKTGVPTSYAFLLGGIYTVRGFDSSSDTERIPKDSGDFKVIRNTQRLIKTNSQYYLIKSELRFPIVGEHGGVLFYDGAAVFVSGIHFDRPYRDAVGVGYRYNTPVGPVAADLAFKIGPDKPEKIFRFHLSIGTF
ncbi:MAG TPA: POTRA domain-containing protein, partial [Bdellovibrionales bacterium]|nr:POTRA domain-containing protein [Bdellovibrionales bacterium]